MRAALVVLTGTLLAAGGEPTPSKSPPAAEGKSSRTDRFGDPLPQGAIARMGSVRLRHAGLSDFVFLFGGKTIVTAGSDRVLRTWDAPTGKQVRAVRLRGAAGPGRCVTLSPDGKTLAAHDRERLVFWEVESGKELKTLPGPSFQLGYLYFSPDGKTLAVGSGNRRVTFWDWRAGKAREIALPVVPRPVVQFNMDSTFHGGFSPDGKWFVSGASSREPLGVFDAATGRLVYSLPCNAYASAVSPDSKRLAVSSVRPGKRPEAVIRLFELASGQLAAEYAPGFEHPYFTLAFSPDGKALACGFSDNSCLLDVGSGRVLHRLSGRPVGVSFSPDGKTLVASSGSRLRFWDVAAGTERHDRPGEFGHNPALAVSPDGRTLAAGDWMEQEVTLWDTADGRLLRRLPLKGEGRYVRDVAFSADGRTVIACQAMGFLQFWDAASGEERRTAQLRDPAEPKRASAYFSRLRPLPDGKHVAALDSITSGRASTRLALWETATGKPMRQELFLGDARGGAWSADGKVGALPLADTLVVVEPATCRVRCRIAGTADRGPVAVAPDGRLVACRLTNAGAGAGAGAVGVWDAATGKKVAVVPAGRVEHLALTPDGRSLVTTDERFLRVWDVASGKERRRWPLPEAGTDSWGRTFVYGLVLSPGSRRAFTALADGTALVWDLNPALRP